MLNTPSAEYAVGNLLRITMTDFLIYEHCEVHPGPHLNIIMGPNGSGKSTVVW